MPIAITRAQSYDPAVCEAAVEQVFRLLQAPKAIGPDTKILLKPNLLSKSAPDKAVTTHPEIVRAVIHACVRRGARPQNILLADSAGGLYNPAGVQALYKVCGMAAVCAEEGIRMYTACESAARAVENGAVVREFELLRPVLEADFIIDLPKFKTHVMTGMTAATKNLFGCIPGLKKAEWHTRFPDRERFGQMLIDLLLTVKPAMALLDGIVGMEGDGPGGGEPRPIGLVMGCEGSELPLLDAAVCRMMGLDPMRVPYLKAAADRGLLPAEGFDPRLLVGETDAFAPLPNWKLPFTFANGGAGSTDFADSRTRIPAFLAPLARQAEKYIAPHPVIRRSACIGCGRCAEICPQHTILLDEQKKKAKIKINACIRCFCCHEMCPVKAIEVKKLDIFKL